MVELHGRAGLTAGIASGESVRKKLMSTSTKSYCVLAGYELNAEPLARATWCLHF